jgi:glycosyltransferase involved in cell wall biosynthesis
MKQSRQAALQDRTEEAQDAELIPSRPLSLVFFDLLDPLDKTYWAGTSAHIIQTLRSAGHKVDVVGSHLRLPRRIIKWLWYHYYLWFRRRYYHADRDISLTWICTQAGNLKLLFRKNVDAVITSAPPFTAYLNTSRPIFLIHDATWGQVIESYPHLSPARQAKRIVDGGFKLDRKAFGHSNVYPVMASEWAADRVMRDYGVPRDKIAILPFAPNLPGDPPDDIVEAGLKLRGTGACKLLFVGRDWVRKGGPLAVDIAAALNARGLPAELHVIGCRPTDMPPFVHSYGMVSKDNPSEMQLLQRMYAESDFFIMPSQAEAQGIVFIEGAAYGLPAVATDVGGISAVVKNGVWGLLLPLTAAADDYAAWLQQAYLDRERYTALAHAARADYKARLSSEAYARNLTNIILARL